MYEYLLITNCIANVDMIDFICRKRAILNFFNRNVVEFFIGEKVPVNFLIFFHFLYISDHIRVQLHSMTPKKMHYKWILAKNNYVIIGHLNDAMTTKISTVKNMLFTLCLSFFFYSTFLLLFIALTLIITVQPLFFALGKTEFLYVNNHWQWWTDAVSVDFSFIAKVAGIGIVCQIHMHKKSFHEVCFGFFVFCQ